MQAAIAGLALALLAGCAATPWQSGHDAYKRGDYPTARAEFTRCASNGDSTCMALLGALYEERHVYSADHQAEAINWYTLSARHGNGWARTRLTALGQPVPPADLQGAAADTSGALGETLGTIFRMLRR